MSVGPGSTEPVASGATPVTVVVSMASDRLSILHEFFGSLNRFSGIRPLYGFSRKPLTHLLRSSQASVPSWYDPLNYFVTQNGPVHRNRNLPSMLPIRVWNTRTGLLMPIVAPTPVYECFPLPLLQL